jgi:hypothetical protein
MLVGVSIPFLMEVAKAGDRQHTQPMIEAIRKEFK